MPSVICFNKSIHVVLSLILLANSAVLNKAAAFSKLSALTSLHVVSHSSRVRGYDGTGERCHRA